MHKASALCIFLTENGKRKTSFSQNRKLLWKFCAKRGDESAA